jgi:transposase
MDGFRLTARERAELESVVRRPADARQLKRAQGLLAVADGEPAAVVGRRLRVGRSTVYDWLKRYSGCRRGPAAGLRDRPRSGRPPVTTEAAARRLPELLAAEPEAFGYRHAEWTAGLLTDRLAREGLVASDSTVRRTLHALGYRWKRPRFVPRRRSPTWRQAKGG